MNPRTRRLRRQARSSRDARAWLISQPITGEKDGASAVVGYARLFLADKGKARREQRKARERGALLQSFSRTQCERLPVKFRLQALAALASRAP